MCLVAHGDGPSFSNGYFLLKSAKYKERNLPLSVCEVTGKWSNRMSVIVFV
jgi:hypothetical protein